MNFKQTESLKDDSGKKPFDHPRAHTIIGTIALVIALLGLCGVVVTILQYFGITPNSNNVNVNANKNTNRPNNDDDSIIDISECQDLRSALQRINSENNNRMNSREEKVIRAKIEKNGCAEK